MSDKTKSSLIVLAFIIFIAIIILGNVLIIKLVGLNVILSVLLGWLGAIFLGLSLDLIYKN